MLFEQRDGNRDLVTPAAPHNQFVVSLSRCLDKTFEEHETVLALELLGCNVKAEDLCRPPHGYTTSTSIDEGPPAFGLRWCTTSTILALPFGPI